MANHFHRIAKFLITPPEVLAFKKVALRILLRKGSHIRRKFAKGFLFLHRSTPTELNNTFRIGIISAEKWEMLSTTKTFFVAFLVLIMSSSSPVPNPHTNKIEMPGHDNDPRGLPILPFSVDSNRKSDGVSSISPLSDTSPSFPVYKRQGLVVPDFRKDHALTTSENRDAQGVAPSGSGEFARLFAEYSLLSELGWLNGTKPTCDSNGASCPKPNVTFSVNATQRWNPSNFAIQVGESYTIEVVGSQTWGDSDGKIMVDAKGYETHYDVVKKCNIALGECRSYLRNKKRFEASNWMSLICGVGDFTTLYQETAFNERWMPLVEQEFVEYLFAVNDHHSFTANANLKQTGELVCFANDADGLYYDNVGSLEVTITRTSWPPKGVFDDRYLSYLKKQFENFEALETMEPSASSLPTGL